MNKINILDELTINKIAAGEVVERPSSAIKELLENAIDASSKKVVVEIIDGGKKLIRISDNGCGIASSEVEKSFLRHATSKIKKIDDLYDLYSLGFRGEALASISAVSKLEMITKTKEEAIGTKVVVEGGKIILKEPIGTSNGTTIIIKDIFFNTPARQKFLKSTHAETINISDLINKLAIGNPDVQIRYINNNKPMLQTPGDNNTLSAIRSVYGREICENLIEINYESKFFKIEGYIGNNNIYRSNKNLQHIYINKRFVKSKMILDAISESYKGIIPINKQAVCFLYLTINPQSIDVNIHPTKLEVKFENEKEIYVELKEVIKRVLLSTNLVGKYEAPIDIKKNDRKEASKSNEIKIIDKVTPINNIEDIKVVEIEETPVVDNFKSFNEIVNDKKNTTINTSNYLNEFIIKEENDDFLVKDAYLENGKIENIYEENESNDLDEELKESVQEQFFEYSEDEEQFLLNDYNLVGTIFDTYIILTKGNSMYLLDQHAAHEKILYEKYMNKFYQNSINMQLLLDPIVIQLSNVDMLKVEKNLDIFIKFGFDIEIFGNNHIMIRSVPTIFGVPESEKFILEIIDNIEDINNNYELKGERFASMACRSAIKANDRIKSIEIKSLLINLQNCKNPFTCPHGRPTIVEVTKTEIEKMFKRII